MRQFRKSLVTHNGAGGEGIFAQQMEHGGVKGIQCVRLRVRVHTHIHIYTYILTSSISGH